MGTKRDIYNKLGVKIGELELPNDTPEEVWTAKLAEYEQDPPNVVLDVSARQIRQALMLMGVTLEQIETALNSLPEPTKSFALVEWEYSNIFQRDRPLVASVGQLLGWTSQQIDDLWRLAYTL